jgi:hypothetical protein
MEASSFSLRLVQGRRKSIPDSALKRTETTTMVFFVPDLGALSTNDELDVVATDRASFTSPELLSTAISKLCAIRFASSSGKAPRLGHRGMFIAIISPKILLHGRSVLLRAGGEIRLVLIANNEFDSSS